MLERTFTLVGFPPEEVQAPCLVWKDSVPHHEVYLMSPLLILFSAQLGFKTHSALSVFVV